jgi:hypothetical protein
VEVCASHRGHRFKSPAAQRRVVVQDRDTFTRVERWLARRREQAADPQDLLFADRLEPRKVLHPHALRRRAMALLKSSTGNPQATGHDLRHSAANRWIAPVLCSSSVGEPYQLQTHATALGHTHAGTTLLSYVHSYEEATRIHLDCELQADASWTSEEAASLMGIRSEALRQRSHRSGLPASSMGWQSVLTKECAPSWEPISAPWQWEEPQAPKLGRPKGAPSAVPDVLYMLQALAAGRSTQEVAERFRVEPWWVKELETTAIDTFHHVAMQAWPVKVGFHAEKPVSLEEGLVALKVNLNKASEATGKYRCILRSFAQADDPSLLESAWKSWVRCLRGTHLAVDKKARITHLYKWLHAAGIDHRRLRICHQRNPALEQLVESEFVASFGHRPRMYPQQPREGGVRAHLQWDLQPFNDTRRSGSIEGLHAWMLAIGVLSQMEKLHGPCPAL